MNVEQSSYVTHSQAEKDFGETMGQVLSPSRPLQTEEFLKGRHEQLAGIKRALFQPGRHVLIHGLRGVGKSSLAQTAAYSLSERAEPIIIGCDKNSTFRSIVREIYDTSENRDPTIFQKVQEGGGGFSRFGVTLNGKVTISEKAPSDPNSVNEAVRLISFLRSNLSGTPVIVIDEFDQISDSSEQELFTNFIKQVSDRHVAVTFIVCGIGTSSAALMAAHGSADRYFHTVDLKQLPWEARFDIVTYAAGRLNIKVDDDTVIRIARISDGFPHYVHFVSEMLFWRVFGADNGRRSTPDLFETAMLDASARMDMKLRVPYETATQKYQNDYECVLWAVADGHELKRRSVDIFESYKRIMSNRSEEALDRTKFNARMQYLKQPSHACVLQGTRQGWYEFAEKMLRGYVRLRAEQNAVNLDGDHPAVINDRKWKDYR